MVTVEKWKWTSASGAPRMRWEAARHGRDQHGTWLYCPRGTRHLRDDGAVVVQPCDGVQLLPEAGWAAWWWDDERWVSVDVCTRPTLDGSTWRYVDLELDLVLLASGAVEIHDEDELAARVQDGTLPADVAAGSRATARAVAEAMRRGDEPFRSVGWRWLEAARQAHAPPGS